MSEQFVLDSLVTPLSARDMATNKRSVKFLITSESYYSALNTLLTKEFSKENCKFLRAVMMVNPSLGYPAFPEDAVPDNLATVWDRLDWIFTTFIAEDGPLMVNIPYDVREMAKQRPFTEFSFDAAFEAIVDLIAADSYRRLRLQLPAATVAIVERDPDDVDWDATGDRYGATMANR